MSRYELHETVGWPCGAAKGVSTSRPSSSFSIIDTALIGTEVWSDYARPLSGRGVPTAERRENAERECAAMNARERLWLDAA